MNTFPLSAYLGQNITFNITHLDPDTTYDVRCGFLMTRGRRKIDWPAETRFFFRTLGMILEQLRKVKNYPNISLEFLTILVWKNILNLDKIYEF